MSEPVVLPEEQRFAKNAVVLGQAVLASITKLYNEGYQIVNPILVQIAVAAIGAYDPHGLIQGFIENSHEICWDAIKVRDETFFVENVGTIFKYLPTQEVNLFKDLYTTKDVTGKTVISEALKEQIWRLFDAMIKISIKYVHNNRVPYEYNGVKGYRSSFFDNVDVEKHAATWGVALVYNKTY